MTIDKSTFQFLKDLKENNNRDWFNENKSDYLQTKINVEEWLQELIHVFGRTDKDLVGIQAKKSIMRIYRDVRFSKNKDPYKKNFGIWLCKEGRNGNFPGYYMHLEPGNNFIAGGYWMPIPEHLKMIRQEIDYNLEEFLSTFQNKKAKKYFTDIDEGDKLILAPKGFPKDHPGIEYLKLKSFTLSVKLNQTEILGKDSIKKVAEVWEAMLPFNRFLERAIST